MKLVSTILFFFIALTGFSQAPFITTWEITENNVEIYIPHYPGISGFNYTIDFGDGTVLNNVTTSPTHTYSAPGIYTVSITGALPALRFFLNGTVSRKLKSIEQWGDIQWFTMDGAFGNCENLVINATDAPDLSQVENMSAMFWGAYALNSPIDHWNVSNVTDMSFLFYGAYSFNQPLNTWDVSNVTQMNHMFARNDPSSQPFNTIFNQPLDSWDTSNVTDMEKMFYRNEAFNQNIDSWDVSSVTNMAEMFSGATLFNSPLNSWNMSNVTDITSMFSNTHTFNQPLSNWDTSSVEFMQNLFNNASAFNGAVDGWDVSNSSSLSYVFRDAISFNQPINNWDVSGATSLVNMFENATTFNQPLNNWDVSNVTSFSHTFMGASSFNQSLDSWETGNATTMLSMFENATDFNGTIGSWDTSSVVVITDMFNGAAAFNSPIDTWDVSNVNSLRGLFYNATSFNQPLNSWNTSSATSTIYTFRNATSFNQPIDQWNMSNVTNMGGMFDNAASFNKNINNWDVSNAGSMLAIFEDAVSFNQPIGGWDMSSATNLNRFFNGATNFNQPIHSWDVSSATGFNDMLDNTNMSIENLDAFLDRLVDLNIMYRTLGAEGLFYCNEAAVAFLENEQNFNINGAFLSPECFTVSGSVLYDLDTNGCTQDELVSSGLFVNVNNGTTDYAISVDNGMYNLSLGAGTYTLSLQNLPDYIDATPASEIITFPGAIQNELVNFCLSGNQSITDLNITLLPLNDARPGFESTYQLIIKNVGTETLNTVEAIFEFDPTIQTYLSAIPAATTTTTNNAAFTVGALDPLEQAVYQITLLTFQPPTVESGDIIEFSAMVSPDTNDNTPGDNMFNFSQEVVNSFDPNDKRVVQGEEIFIEEATNYLNYIIRFQNTGTANATFVTIEDDLDEDLDWSTFEITSTSHEFTAEIINGNEVVIDFDYINLPYESIDEEGSMGYVTYKIKPKADAQLGDIFSGNARIFFDFNPPIITNTVSTVIVEQLSIEEYLNIENNVVIYPNPSKDYLNIKITNNTPEFLKATLNSITGKELHSTTKESIDVSQLNNGVYFLKIETSAGNIIRKFIKE